MMKDILETIESKEIILKIDIGIRDKGPSARDSIEQSWKVHSLHSHRVVPSLWRKLSWKLPPIYIKIFRG